MSQHRFKSRRFISLTVAAAAGAGLLVTGAFNAGAVNTGGSKADAAKAEISLPPKNGGFDYQIGGAYTPPEGVDIVSRDHTAKPADKLYNICYVNAFQTQPGAEGEWEDDLLLRDDNGDVVYDGKWKEAVLDTRTDDKRKRIAEKVNGWIDDCASKGFQAVEPDNLDTYDRFDQLDAEGAKALSKRLADHAHSKGLAIAQKNTSELAEARDELGTDFAVAEECGHWEECGSYAEAYDDRVVVIEYGAEGMERACSGWKDRLSIVKRDENVTPEGDPEHVRETC
ncbi:endo alpha-1,4 polygalactosaminidase [Streptomyces sp. NBC_01187]|uniref:endo alpha-1,4 polygalactosaminidase n=1 Tax=unclassified Streptomyces TaxID=2593676 RepID=UPI00386ED08D